MVFLGFLGFQHLPFPLEKFGNSLQIRCNTVESCSCLQKIKIPQLFQPHWTVLIVPMYWTYTSSIYLVEAAVKLWLVIQAAQWHTEHQLSSQAVKPQVRTIYWVHPFGLTTKAGLCHSVKLCPEGRSCLHKENSTSLCLAACFRVLCIPKQSFRIYPNWYARCWTEPSRYVCLGWSEVFLFTPFLLFLEHISARIWKYFIIFIDDLHFRGSTWTSADLFPNLWLILWEKEDLGFYTQQTIII